MKKLFEKYREIIMYLIFGVLTTAVGFGTYFILLLGAERVLGLEDGQPAYNIARVIAQILQWVLAVLFAYFTNKKFVFRAGEGNEAKRLTSFFASRLFSLGADSLVTFGTIWLLTIFSYQPFATRFGFLPFTLTFTADLWGKLAAAVVVIVLNYILSKFIVFRKVD